MKSFNLTFRLFWMITFSLIIAQSCVVIYLYFQSESLVLQNAYSKAKTLQNYFVSMRYIYQKQFLSSGIDLNDKTVGFLPAHATSYISEEFSKRTNDGVKIRNVSDRPRNPMNKADPLEEQMISYFNQNPDKDEYMKLIEEKGDEFYFFTSPLRIEAHCLACHGKKEEVLPYISHHYSTAYDYVLGEVRGIISIKIPKKSLFESIFQLFWQEVVFSFSITVLLLIFMFFIIKDETKNDVIKKKELEDLINERTEKLVQKSDELEKAYARQQHLYSILRTVADSNQILITTKTLEELIHQTALCLFSNVSFSHVKIALVEEGALKVKEFYGFDEDQHISFIEEYVFEHNTFLSLTPQKDTVYSKYRKIIEKYNITEIYAISLTSDKFSDKPLGVLSICTTIEGGFSEEERSMIEELAGDIGFAVNSFLQKESIEKLSYYDTLTGLANKAMLIEHMRLALNTSKSTHTQGALLFLDIDNFKSINDLKGHLCGDKLLIKIAERLEKNVLSEGIVARFGGDEFAVLMPSFSTTTQETVVRSEELALKILIAIKEPFVIDGQLLHITASIGISILTEDESVENLLSRSDSAMYLAKDAGKDTIRFFDKTIQKNMEAKSLMLQELHTAVEKKEFILHYQVQTNQERDVVGVEALVRWLHTDKGLISPAYFIPLCEESGLIILLGRWVLQQAIRQVAFWKNDIEKSQWRISINVSTKQFEQEDFVSTVKQLVQQEGVNPSLIRLELTESILIGDVKKVIEKIAELKDIGISLSVDDFGTGYSSLQYLKELSVDELKIDQSFVRDFLTQKSDALLVEAIISIGNKFNMNIIAEGVETQEQFEQLKLLGCQYFQGYYFGKPLPPELL